MEEYEACGNSAEVFNRKYFDSQTGGVLSMEKIGAHLRNSRKANRERPEIKALANAARRMFGPNLTDNGAGRCFQFCKSGQWNPFKTDAKIAGKLQELLETDEYVKRCYEDLNLQDQLQS